VKTIKKIVKKTLVSVLVKLHLVVIQIVVANVRAIVSVRQLTSEPTSSDFKACWLSIKGEK